MKIESDKILEERIKEVVLSGNKQIDFNEIFPFGWDSLIILIPYSSPSIIGQNQKVDFRPVYGTEIEHRDDICVIAIFNNGNIENMVEYPRYQGDFADNEIRFVRKDHAIYKIKIIDSKNQAGNN